MTLSQDLNACAAIVEKGDPDRFWSAMAATPKARRVLFPLYAFNVEVSRAPWVTEEPLIAEMRLQWWRDALEEIASGGPVRRHEVVTPLAEVLDAESARNLDRLVAARYWDIHRDPFEDQAALDVHIAATAGTLLEAAGKALGQSDTQVLGEAGYALGVANWLAAIPELEARGRMPMADGRPEAVAGWAEKALKRLKTARKNRRAVLSSAREALWGVGDAAAVLQLAASHPGRVASGSLQVNPMRVSAARLARRVTGKW